MCQLIICKTKKPDLAELQKHETSNRDGAGIAWLEKSTGKIRYAKGLTANRLSAIMSYVELPFIIHFRQSSCGKVHPKLTHPFEWSKESLLSRRGDCNRVLFHNGHYGRYTDDFNLLFYTGANKGIVSGQQDMYTDTRMMAMVAATVESKTGYENSIEYLKSTGQKIALFDKDKGIVIINEDKWHKIADDICYSSYFYDTPIYNTYDEYSGYGSYGEYYTRFDRYRNNCVDNIKDKEKNKAASYTMVNGELVKVEEIVPTVQEPKDTLEEEAVLPKECEDCHMDHECGYCQIYYDNIRKDQKVIDVIDEHVIEGQMALEEELEKIAEERGKELSIEQQAIKTI